MSVNSNKQKIQAVIFDWAGTIVDYGCFAPTKVFLKVFEQKGINVTIKQARQPMGMHKREHIKTIAYMEPIKTQWIELYGSHCSEADIDELYKKFIPEQLKVIREYSSFVPGLLEVIDSLRIQNILIGSTTGYNHEMMEIVLEESKKNGFIPDCVVNGSMVSAGRPAPFMIYKNLIELGVYPAANVIKVGDTVVDILEGVNANVWSVGVISSSNEMGLSLDEFNSLDPGKLEEMRNGVIKKYTDAGAHFTIDSMEELPELINEINNLIAQGIKP